MNPIQFALKVLAKIIINVFWNYLPSAIYGQVNKTTHKLFSKDEDDVILLKIYLLLFYVYECFTCIRICVPLAHLASTEARRRWWISRNWSNRQLWITGDAGSSAGAASVLNCWATTVPLTHYLLLLLWFFGFCLYVKNLNARLKSQIFSCRVQCMADTWDAIAPSLDSSEKLNHQRNNGHEVIYDHRTLSTTLATTATSSQGTAIYWQLLFHHQYLQSEHAQSLPFSH